MHFSRRDLFFIIAAIICLIVGSVYLLKSARGRTLITHINQNSAQQEVKGIQASPTEIKVGDKIKVKYPVNYTIVLVGDSMTERLGNSDELRANLKKYYPGKTFEVLNYGFGSTNILSLQQRLTENTFNGRTFRPITDIDFNLILIESMGHNPLSEYPLNIGLQKQTEALDKIVSTIKERNPNAKIAFVATIAPNKHQYAKNQVDLSNEERQKWAEERIAYIKNHMDYAKTHNIPLIDIFDKSLNSDGDTDLDYINKDDYIHPSPNGIYLISDGMAKYIFENKLL